MASNILKVIIMNSDNEEQICGVMDAIIRDPLTIKVSRISEQGYEYLEIERENSSSITNREITIKGDWKNEELPSTIALQLMAIFELAFSRF